MSAREQVITMLDDLTEEQLELLITFLNSMESKATKQKNLLHLFMVSFMMLPILCWLHQKAKHGHMQQ